ncbi:NEDD4 family-interacting protein 2-like [Sinocyclocheilus grahami]|uniref:NEDD4 family-interacting protein 2-like n=1 Tax=Sinocyclocheilus grahami TaxID=75366 RepID=UPI0007AD4383|nr:PREDICTED: NEDD4 family-interacting protein 2-like [Sinocyclocheilus grahami]
MVLTLNFCDSILPQLHNEDDPSEGAAGAEPSTSSQAAAAFAGISNPAVDTEAPPPSYASVALGATAAPESTFPGDFPVPPPYSIATSLPTYDEAEKAKAAAMAVSAVEVIPRVSISSAYAPTRSAEPNAKPSIRTTFHCSFGTVQKNSLKGNTLLYSSVVSCGISVEPGWVTTKGVESTFPGDFPVPPPYSIATSLPTYDEAEKAKAAAMAVSAVEVIPRVSISSAYAPTRSAEPNAKPSIRTTFHCSFVAFLFNWIGFCLSFCLTNTIAGRYGAICGFGLSLIKWILIVRFSDYFTGYFNGQYWLWWIFLVLGLLLFFRGFVNYLKVRNMSESMASSLRTRFFLLY